MKPARSFFQLIALIAVTIPVTFTSCYKKQDDNKEPPLYMKLKCKINGQYRELRGDALIGPDTYSNSSGTGHTLTLYGYFASPEQTFSITLTDPARIQTGVEYKQFPVYNNGNSIRYDSALATVYTSNQLPVGVPQYFKCSLTELKNDYRTAHGYIEANLYTQPSPGILRKLTLTEGEFDIRK